MRALCALLVAAICCALPIAGCARTTPPAQTTPPAETADLPTQLTDLASVLEKELLYLGPDGTSQLIVDPAAGDKTYAISGNAAALLSGVAPFSVVSFRLNSPDNTVFLAERMPPVRRNVPVVAAADAAEAAQLYPAALMDCLLFSCREEYAIEDYDIKSATVLDSEGPRVTIEFVVDLKPVNDPFATVRARWGQPAEDGYVRDHRLVLNLYGHGGLYCTYMAGWGNIFSEGAPAVERTARETLYKPEVFPDSWQALTEGRDVEQVIWEDDVYSFITNVRLSGPEGQQYFDMTIYRIERATGDRLALFDILRDTISVKPLALRGRTLYLQTLMAVPYSEGCSGHVASMDLDTGEYTVLLTEPADVFGKVGETFYVAELAASEGQEPGGIYGLNVATGELKRVSDLPGPSYSTSWATASLMHYTGGRLYIFWPDWSAGEGLFRLYAIDPVLGTIEEQMK